MTRDPDPGPGDGHADHLSDDRRRLYEKLRGQKHGGDASADWSPLVPIQPDGPTPPFFLVHAILGSIFPYHRFGEALGAHRAVYGLQARGLDGRTSPIETIPDMARAYVDAIRTVQAVGPYLLGGYSMGGWIALEMAHQLRSHGDDVALLVALGTPAPLGGDAPGAAAARWLAEYTNDFFTLWRNTALADSPELQQSFFGGHDGAAPSGAWPTLRVAMTNAAAQARYVADAYDGAVDVVLTPEQTALYSEDPTMGWNALSSGEVTVHHLEGNHFNLFQEPQVQELARIVAGRLDSVLRQGANDGRS